MSTQTSEKYVKIEYESPTTKPTNSMTPVMDARMEPMQSKERLCFKIDLTTSTTSSLTPAVIEQKKE